MGLGNQLKIAGSCFRSLITHPFVLVYPMLTGLGIVGTLLGFASLALFMATPVGPTLPDSTVVWGIYFVLLVPMVFLGLPLLITTMKVAYCYELHELYQGRRPMPLAGLFVALTNLKRIVLGTVIIAGIFNGGRLAAGTMGSVGNAAGTATMAGSDVLSTFMAPAIAIEDASAQATAQHVTEAVEKQWGEAFAVSYSVGKIAGALFCLGLFGGIGIIASFYLGVFPLAMEPTTVLLLGVLSPFAGFFAAASFKSLTDGPISTALYIHAVEGDQPDRFGLSVAQVANIS
ncbi:MULTISPECIES: hypothetical protein [Haloarcula]|uniref:hypothetical protein n=1 Tax=Haloarcula TaxID=2237 RepID=UPI0023E7E87E|nr:hypothetical protein [Halomicroarcula sp. SHR3]